MMRYVWCIVAAGSVLLAAGCSGGGSEKLATEDPAHYAAKIKAQVEDLAQAEDMDGLTSKASAMVEELEVYQSQPVGEYEQVYAQMLETCRELQSAADSGNRSQVTAKVKEMKELADKLPGGE